MSNWRTIISLQHPIITAQITITILMNSRILWMSTKTLPKMSFHWRKFRITRFSSSKISTTILTKCYQVNPIFNKKVPSQRHLLAIMTTMDFWVLKKMKITWILISKVVSKQKQNSWIKRSSRVMLKLRQLVKTVIIWMMLQ